MSKLNYKYLCVYKRRLYDKTNLKLFYSLLINFDRLYALEEHYCV